MLIFQQSQTTIYTQISNKPVIDASKVINKVYSSPVSMMVKYDSATLNPSDLNVITYELYMKESTKSDFYCVSGCDSKYIDIQRYLPNLFPYKLYIFKYRALNGIGYSDFSNEYSHYTGVITSRPTKPILSYFDDFYADVNLLLAEDDGGADMVDV
jgi:hypothetical protein